MTVGLSCAAQVRRGCLLAARAAEHTTTAWSAPRPPVARRLAVKRGRTAGADWADQHCSLPRTHNLRHFKDIVR